MKVRKFGTIVVALSMLVLSSLGVVGLASAAPSTGANLIVIRAQDTNNNQVMVESVTAAQNGWLLIRKDANGMPGQVIGYAPVRQGLNTGFSVDIKSAQKNGDDNTTSTLWATLVADENALRAYATPSDDRADQMSSQAVATFGSTAAATSAVALLLPTTGGLSTSRITVRAQDTNNGQVIVDSATAAQDGWLLIRKDANGMPGQVIGYASVRQGLNSGLRVNIKSAQKNGDDNMTPTLWATLVADQNALNAYATPSDDRADQKGSQAMATFGSTAAGTAAATSAVALLLLPTTGGLSTSRITVRAQDTNNGQVIVDSATASQNGWLLIRKDANGMPGQVIGHAPVRQGLNSSLRVNIKSTQKNGDDNTTPTLWATLVADQNALNAFAQLGDGIAQLSSQAVATFGSTAQ